MFNEDSGVANLLALIFGVLTAALTIVGLVLNQRVKIRDRRHAEDLARLAREHDRKLADLQAQAPALAKRAQIGHVVIDVLIDMSSVLERMYMTIGEEGNYLIRLRDDFTIHMNDFLTARDSLAEASKNLLKLSDGSWEKLINEVLARCRTLEIHVNEHLSIKQIRVEAIEVYSLREEVNVARAKMLGLIENM